ncbi:MAG: hypothetical protein ACP5KE_07120 [Candidatus Methanodesulfokora sp.]
MEDEVNLDRLCAEYGHKIAEEVGNTHVKRPDVLIIDALSVLQEQGLYAFVLFCRSRSREEKEGAKKIEDLTKDLLKNLNLISNGDLLDELRKDNGLLTRLNELMFAVQVLEKALIYAKFHAKAAKGG